MLKEVEEPLVELPELRDVLEKLVEKEVEEPLVREDELLCDVLERLVLKEVEEPPMQVKQGAKVVCWQDWL